MKGVLLGQLADIAQRRPNIVRREIVLALNFVHRHPACEAADDDCDGYAGPGHHGLAVTDSGIEDNSIRGVHEGNNIVR